jgi:hypothetical protein
LTLFDEIARPEFYEAKVVAAKQREAVELARTEYDNHITEHGCAY